MVVAGLRTDCARPVADVLIERHTVHDMRIHSLLPIALLSSCSAVPGGPCGESFCLPAGATVEDRRSPAEDFNLYRVRSPAGEFIIYEGDAPQALGLPGERVSVPLDSKAILARREGHGSIVVKTGAGKWPKYLEVNGQCAQSNDCDVLDFAEHLTHR